MGSFICIFVLVTQWSIPLLWLFISDYRTNRLKRKKSFVHNIRLVIVVLRTISSTRTETFISNIRVEIVVDKYYMD